MNFRWRLLCASLGHVVEEADPNLDMAALWPMNARISAANTALTCNMRWKALGRPPNADDVEAATWAVYQRGLQVSGVELRRGDRCRARGRAQDGRVPHAL